MVFPSLNRLNQEKIMESELETFLLPYPQAMRDLVQQTRALILEIMPDMVEQYDPSAKLIGYGTDRTYRGLVCGIVIQKTYLNLMFARGTELPDPEHLLQGSGKRARHVKIKNSADLDKPGVRALLSASLRLHRA